MLRKFFFLAILLSCLGTTVVHAQFSGTDSGSQGTDCSSPQNASSPACSGAGAFQTTPGYGQGQGAYGSEQGGYGPGGYSQQMPYGANALGGATGLNIPVPTYSDQVLYGRQPYGAYRNPYNPYAGFNRREPLTDFQRTVAGSVGAILPIFGADLFSDLSAPFVPIDRTPVTADYVVGTGDQLLIRVWGQVNFNSHVTVDRAGDIYIPQVGNIEVAGLHFEQLDGYLKKQLGRVFRNFDLSVNMGQLRSIQVYVVGNARRPGSYTLSSLSTLVNALFSSGGPSSEGSMRQIQLKRGGQVVTTFDLYDLLIKGDKSHDAPLLPGDVIYIPAVGPQIAVAGSVHIPAIYELIGTETAGQVIELAGGLTNMASREQAQLERTGMQDSRQAVQIALDKAGLDTPLRDGDILRIPSIERRLERTVTLRGNVANPGLYRWKPGMRITDLIPNKDALETRGYWQRRIALGLPAPEYTPLFSSYRANLPNPLNLTGQTNPNEPQPYVTGSSLAGSQNGEYDAQQQQSSEQVQELPPANNANGSANSTNAANGSAAPDASGTTPGTSAQQSRQGPRQTVWQSQNHFPGSKNMANPRNGEVPQLRYYPPGSRFSQGQFPIQNEILRIAPTIDWSYAAVERTDPHTLATTLIPFSPGKAILDHDPTQNLQLESGDIVTIFSTADIHVPQAQQVKYVRLEGEVVHAGIYSVGPGETLRDVVRRAGGLTPKAYLYGSEFLRESAQRLQQERLNEYVNSIERDIQLTSANAAGTLVNANGVAALGTSLQSQQQLITTLRRMRATGRIVLNLTPYSQGVASLPDLPLEDGDRFVVPVTPASVSVVGAVYDQNSFIYRRGNHIGDYLRISGGSNKNADRRHEFVIRADGSVLSKQTSGGRVFGGGFDSKLVYPGDTVVVPDNVSKTSVLRNLTDISAVFGQFGLGIAALTLFGL
ncbi:MAG TPA: SLBB domain-containing protein [Acidobacteriaceae bacterium]|nr:SLBB domain-containing protein [Acidobacteriaceae bacterium]